MQRDPLAVGGDRLETRIEEGDVCLTVRGSGEPGEPECLPVPDSPFAPQVVAGPGGRAVALLVAPEVATAELDGVRAATAAVPGTRGRAVLLPRGEAADVLRFLDRRGAVIGAATDDASPFAGGTPLFRAGDMAIGGVRGVDLRPDPLRLDRRVGSTCLLVDDERDCVPDDRRNDIAPVVKGACAPDRGVLSGLLPAEAAVVDVVLGDGRSLRVRARRLPARVGPGRLLAEEVPRGMAVREAVARDAAGRVVARERVGAGPTGLPCAPTATVVNFLSVSAPAATHGPPTGRFAALEPGVALADGASAGVCLRLSAARRPSCGPAPVDAASALVAHRGDVVAGIVARDTARVRLRLEGGRTVEAVTAPVGAGRYAGRVRRFSAPVAARTRVERGTAFGTGGRRLGELLVLDTTGYRVTGRPIAPGLDLQTVTATTRGRATTSHCVQVRRPTDEAPVCGPSEFPTARAIVSCAPRRAVAYGELATGTRRARIELAGGRTLPARTVRAGGRRIAWIRELPPGAEMRAVRFAPRPRSDGLPIPARVALAVPAAMAQCGYRTSSDPP